MEETEGRKNTCYKFIQNAVEEIFKRETNNIHHFLEKQANLENKDSDIIIPTFMEYKSKFKYWKFIFKETGNYYSISRQFFTHYFIQLVDDKQNIIYINDTLMIGSAK